MSNGFISETMQKVYAGAVSIAATEVDSAFEATGDAELALRKVERLERVLRFIASRRKWSQAWYAGMQSGWVYRR